MTRNHQGETMWCFHRHSWAFALVVSLLLLGGFSPRAVGQDTELSVLQDVRTELEDLRTDLETVQDETETAIYDGLQPIYTLILFIGFTGLFVFGLDRGIPR